MGIFDEIAAEATRPVKPCIVGRWLLTLDTGDAADVERALANLSIPTAHILRVIARHGYTGSDNPIYIHRTGRCGCVAR